MHELKELRNNLGFHGFQNLAEFFQLQVKLFSDSVEISLGYEPTPGKLVLGVIQGRGVSQGGRDILRVFKFLGSTQSCSLLTSLSNF